jgi:hypothetical protein
VGLSGWSADKDGNGGWPAVCVWTRALDPQTLLAVFHDLRNACWKHSSLESLLQTKTKNSCLNFPLFVAQSTILRPAL